MSHPDVTIGIDLGGTSTRVGLFDRSLRLLARRSIPTRVQAGPQSVVEEIAQVIRELLADPSNASSHNTTVEIGIGSPGPINLRTGVLGLLPNLPGWDNFPLRDALHVATGIPVTLESDANAAALAEWKFGAGKSTGLSSMAMITLGTGVGSGLILNGKVWQGMFGMGGEVGHTTVDPQGPMCGCGSRGCLEMYASSNGLIRFARAMAATPVATSALRTLVAKAHGFSPLEVAQLAECGDISAGLAFERLGYYLGIGIANLINTLDLPMVIIGGGVASAWPLFAESMYKTVRDFSVVYRLVAPTQRETLETDCTFICPATLGPAAGLLGAGLLPHFESMQKSAASLNRAEEPRQPGGEPRDQETT